MLGQYEGKTYPISQEDIETFEKKYNLKLPSEYQNFLLKHNGGMPTARRFKIKDGKIKSSFKFIMPLMKEINNDEVKHNLEYSYIKFIRRNVIPDKYLPFGEDPRENILCISIKGDDYGSVFYWDREAELIDKIPQDECYHLIDNNFSKFIDGLKENDTQLL
jgi:cell wall assembly regulator SMI1